MIMCNPALKAREIIKNPQEAAIFWRFLCFLCLPSGYTVTRYILDYVTRYTLKKWRSSALFLSGYTITPVTLKKHKGGMIFRWKGTVSW